MYGNFDVGGFQFSRRDGLFSVALSHRLANGFKIAFFHAMVSDVEFVVSTEILRNETLAKRTYHGKDYKVIMKSFDIHFWNDPTNDFKVLGHRGGEKSQAGIHIFDPKTRVMFTTMLQRNAVDCWRFDLGFSPALMDTVDQNDETLYYPVDITASEV